MAVGRRGQAGVADNRALGYARSMSSVFDQQPIQRTVGRRRSRDGQPLTPEDRAAVAANARYVTRAPKGVFRYRSAEEMDADRLRWLVDAIVERQR
ncbi:MAG: hypothetical protein IT481_12115 [Gammaproteobacteria bacterium]|nr:hypothetical protein [Gammaproteobacteria bacterium]